MGTRQDRLEDYEGFVEKFRPKKTTDDCYTPTAVYEAVKAWTSSSEAATRSTSVRWARSPSSWSGLCRRSSGTRRIRTGGG